MSRTLLALGLSALLSSSACHHRKETKPPYARSDAPSPELLLEALEPRYASLRVPKAKIREGRSPAARLLVRAEHPGRMLGTIEVVGNPLVSLAIHEQGYALRNLRGQPGLAEGYYHGPPSRCAVSALLGVDVQSDQIVALLLGGGPRLEGDIQVVKQGWKDGRERLTVRNANFEERLEFVWRNDAWWFAGASLYYLDGNTPRWLWTIRHTKIESEGGKVLPSRTQIKRPTGKGKDRIELNISYLSQVANDFDAQGGDESGPPDEGGDEGEPGWEDDGGWDDDGGWEGDEDAGEVEAQEDPPPEPAVDPLAEIPDAYKLAPGGLADRGDLCR